MAVVLLSFEDNIWQVIYDKETNTYIFQHSKAGSPFKNIESFDDDLSARMYFAGFVSAGLKYTKINTSRIKDGHA